MTVDLRTCVPGQLVELRDGRIVRYIKKRPQDIVYPHKAGDCTYTDDGYYYANKEEDDDDVVKIIPMAKPEQPKSDIHSSVAWWESCPWITDRQPTVNDTPQDYISANMVLVRKNEGVTLKWYTEVKKDEAWIHMHTWQPSNQTPKEKALALIANHEDGWIPTPDQWNIIREGLAE